MLEIKLSLEAIIGLLTVLSTVIGLVYHIGRTKEKIENLNKEIAVLKNGLLEHGTNLNNHLKDYQFLKGSLVSSAPSVDRLSESNSPRRLSEAGIKVLKDSKIEEVTDAHYQSILDDVRDRNPENAYQAQEAIYVAVADLIENDDIRNFVEEGAFLSGYTPKDVLFVAALNIRDKIIADLGMNTEDIDKYTP